MVIDGRAIADEIVDNAKKVALTLPGVPSFVALAVSPSAATNSYLRIKERQAARAGVSMEVLSLPEESSTEEVVEAILSDTHDAVIVQLPLPPHIDLQAVLAAIPVEKDADVLSPSARSVGLVMHPIVHAVKTILEQTNTLPAGLRAVVIGKGWLVGQPVADWLTQAGVEVTVVTRESGDIAALTRSADLIVSGAGVSELVTPEMVHPGAVVIDVGTSELGGSLRGDVAPAVAEIAGVFTPVPGGVGPIAVAYLMENVVALAQAKRLQGPQKAV
ncbi:MAG: bifunctional 5,10-methylenetetrahydrofolate dehydrogenase/5,10-methenyltetrahydrofolate cyclohydrolase [Patescibacteria group bacterium]